MITAGPTRRALELLTSGTIALFGGAVAGDSLGHDIGWNANGPGSGYFPFRVGVLLILASAAVGLPAARAAAGAPFATRAQIGRSLHVFWPTATLVAAMFALGCYVPSALYIAWMMRAHGGYRSLRALLTGALVMTAFFAIFESWFQVPLAKGPLEALFGVY